MIGRRQKSEVRSQKSGFTLIEVMLAVSVLALGTLIIQQGLLRSANVLGHASNVLTVQSRADQKIWDVKETFLYAAAPSAEGQNGSFTGQGREFHWVVKAELLEPEQEFYLLRLTVNWLEGNKPMEFKREIYATNNKKI